MSELKPIVISSLQASHMCHTCATEVIPRLNAIIEGLKASKQPAPKQAPKQRRTKKESE